MINQDNVLNSKPETDADIDVTDWMSNLDELIKLRQGKHCIPLGPNTTGKTSMLEIAKSLTKARKQRIDAIKSHFEEHFGERASLHSSVPSRLE